MAQKPPATVQAPAPPQQAKVEVVDAAAVAAARAEEAAARAAEEAARETAEQARRLAEDEANSAAREAATAAREEYLEQLGLMLAETDPAPNPGDIRNVMNGALEHGATDAEVLAARQYIQTYLLGELAKILADPQDGHHWVYTLWHYIEDAMRQGAARTNPTMAAAWKAYEEGVSAEFEKALQAGELRIAYDLLLHMRVQAKNELGQKIASAESRLHTMVAGIVDSPEGVKSDISKLGQAIGIARGEELSCKIQEADEFKNLEDSRVAIVQGISAAIENGDADGLLTLLQEANFLGLTDPEVAQGSQHLQGVVQGQLAEVQQSASALTSADTAGMTDEQVERIFNLAESAGADAAETQGARAELGKRARAKVQQVMGAPMDDSVTLRSDIDNLETAVHSRFLTKAEQVQDQSSANQKLVQLVQSSTLPLHSRAQVLRHVSGGERDVDQEVLKSQTSTLQAAVLQELQDAAAAMDAARLEDSIEAAMLTSVVAENLQVPADALKDAYAQAAQTVETVHLRASTMTHVESKSTQAGLKRLKAAVEDARNAGCSPQQLAPYEQMITEREGAIEAARAKIRAALLGEFTGGGRRLADGPSKTAEQIEAELAHLRAVHTMIQEEYPDIVADGDPFLDQLLAKIAELEAKRP